MMIEIDNPVELIVELSFINGLLYRSEYKFETPHRDNLMKQLMKYKEVKK